ncbi:MAG: family 16 glycoside hydrolase [Pirellulaceae bacterium]|nr:family 16 glycoside hydrolase [Pirellulaceae bacterium]
MRFVINAFVILSISYLAIATQAQENPAKPSEAPASEPVVVAADENSTEKTVKENRPNRAAEKKSEKSAPKGKSSSGDKATPKSEPQAPPARKPLTNFGSLTHPQIPGQPWRIHDLKRRRPNAIAPGVIDSMPPADARVLFDGTNLDEWYQLGGEEELYEAQWKIQDGYFEIVPRTGSILTLDSFESCQLHIEWFIPEGTQGAGQGRGNSGIKLMERYEVQILDSYKSRTYADGQAASIYGQYPPLVNATRPQGEWQTYEIVFEAPRYEEGKMVRPPYITLFHNGVLVHNHRELAGPTGLRGSPKDFVPPAAPIMLQDHGNRIRFRNIWIRDL